MFTAESFGGPDRFTRELGFQHLIDVHRGLRITEEQRSASSSSTWPRSTRRGCPTTSRSARPCASTSSSAPGWRCRTRTRAPTRSCTRCARSRTGRGPTSRDAARSVTSPLVMPFGGVRGSTDRGGLRHRFDDEGADVDLELGGKVAVVTGASKGIGLAITRALAAEGALVVAGARTTDALEGLGGVTAVAVDLAADDGPALLVQRALDEHGRLDVLVNNVGAVRLRLDGFLGTSDEEFEWAMQMNFFTALRATRAAIPADGQAGRRRDRQRRLGQRVLPARRRHDRLRRREGRAGQPDQVARAGVRPAGHPRQLRLARPGRAPTSGWATTASPRPSRRRAASTPTPRARRSSPASAGSRPGASPRPRRSRRSWCCSPRSAPPTSPAPTTSSTAA